MKNKQDGWSKTPNGMFDLIPSLSFAELKIMLVLTRATIGWHRKEVAVSRSDISSWTGLHPRTISDAVSSLKKIGAITVKMNAGGSNVYSVNDDFDDCPEAPETSDPRVADSIPPRVVGSIPPRVSGSIPPKVNSLFDEELFVPKERIKERIKKDIIYNTEIPQKVSGSAKMDDPKPIGKASKSAKKDEQKPIDKILYNRIKNIFLERGDEFASWAEEGVAIKAIAKRILLLSEGYEDLSVKMVDAILAMFFKLNKEDAFFKNLPCLPNTLHSIKIWNSLLKKMKDSQAMQESHVDVTMEELGALIE